MTSQEVSGIISKNHPDHKRLFVVTIKPCGCWISTRLVYEADEPMYNPPRPDKRQAVCEMTAREADNYPLYCRKHQSVKPAPV